MWGGPDKMQLVMWKILSRSIKHFLVCSADKKWEVQPEVESTPHVASFSQSLFFSFQEKSKQMWEYKSPPFWKLPLLILTLSVVLLSVKQHPDSHLSHWDHILPFSDSMSFRPVQPWAETSLRRMEPLALLSPWSKISISLTYLIYVDLCTAGKINYSFV